MTSTTVTGYIAGGWAIACTEDDIREEIVASVSPSWHYKVLLVE